MATEPTNPLTLKEAEAKIAECRAMALRARFPEHRIMLEHMADTWGRIARGLDE